MNRVVLTAALAALAATAPGAAAQTGRPPGPAPAARTASFKPSAPPEICAGNLFSDQIGTEDGDLLTAARRPERLWGLAGPDVLTGSPTRAACLFGGRDPDRLALEAGGGAAFGEDGADLLTGSPLDDLLDGGSGGDVLDAGAGADWVFGGAGLDSVSGGPGDDLVDSADGHAEMVDCGEGTDLVAADRADVLIGCERPSTAGGPLATLRPVPRAARKEEVVRVRVKLPEAAGPGGYRLILAAGAEGDGCPAPGLELARFPGAGDRLARGRTLPISLQPPAGGWCAGQVSVVFVLVRHCRSGGSCQAPQPAKPLARLSFRSVG